MARCADPTVGGAVAILRAIVERAAAWDRAAPHDYDHRWVNLRGMGAFGVRPGDPLSRMDGTLSPPRRSGFAWRPGPLGRAQVTERAPVSRWAITNEVQVQPTVPAT